MEYPAARSPDRCPAHPGELLRDVVIPATGRAKSEIAALLGISRQHLYDILRERKPVTPGVAVRLGKLWRRLGVCVRMQADHDQATTYWAAFSEGIVSQATRPIHPCP